MISLNEVSAALKELAARLDKLEQAAAIVRTELQEAKEEIARKLDALSAACSKE